MQEKFLGTNIIETTHSIAFYMNFLSRFVRQPAYFPSTVFITLMLSQCNFTLVSVNRDAIHPWKARSPGAAYDKVLLPTALSVCIMFLAIAFKGKKSRLSGGHSRQSSRKGIIMPLFVKQR